MKSTFRIPQELSNPHLKKMKSLLIYSNIFHASMKDYHVVINNKGLKIKSQKIWHHNRKLKNKKNEHYHKIYAY